MFNWYSPSLDFVNLLVVIGVAALIVKDFRVINRRFRRKVFKNVIPAS